MTQLRLVLSVLSFSALLPVNASAQERLLPNWYSPKQESGDGLPPVFRSPLGSPNNFRVPAEYEPIAGVVLSWTGATDFLAEIARSIINNSSANLVVADGPSSIDGVPANRYTALNCPIDTLWVRDYGPVGMTIDSHEVGFVDSIYRHFQSRRNDDALPACMAQQLQHRSFGADLILDGGNFLIDSAGSLFTTKRTFEWNSKQSTEKVKKTLKENYGAKTIHLLNYASSGGKPKDGTGHIDMFVKLLSSNVVLISEASTEPFRSTVEEAVAYFKSIKAPGNVPYTILRVPGWYENSTWYTYTNSLVVNGLALVPRYAYFQEQNRIAQSVYEKAGFKVVMIDSDRTIGQGGSIHCVTQTIPAAN